MVRDRASPPEARPWRLFVAADVPDDVRARLAERLDPIRAAHPELRWSPPENWHVTLKFLGAVWPALVAGASDAVAKVARANERFETRLTGADAFPNARRARVVWVGLADSDHRFASVARMLDEALAGMVKLEERPFTAHLTVARAKQPLAIGDALEAMGDLEWEPFVVDRLVLYRSHLRRPAPLYEPVEAFPLQ